jgi:hypothetical protein
MDENRSDIEAPVKEKFHFGCLHVLLIAAVVFFATVLLTAWWIKYNMYASKFTPTVLSSKEQKVLENKLSRLEESAEKDRVVERAKRSESRSPLEPEPYTEVGAKREISLTEKELNALIANNPEVARRVAIDLSKDLMSLKLVVPMDEEIPVLGGKTLRLKMGLELGYEDERPIIALKGVSLGGIPLPNAWLGNLKHKNLVDEFSTEEGFWDLFADGVDDIKVKEGHIRIRLKE